MTLSRSISSITNLTFGVLFGSCLAQWGQDLALYLTSGTSAGCLLLLVLKDRRQGRQEQQYHELLEQRCREIAEGSTRGGTGQAAGAAA
jgi:hypothetical protein